MGYVFTHVPQNILCTPWGHAILKRIGHPCGNHAFGWFYKPVVSRCHVAIWSQACSVFFFFKYMYLASSTVAKYHV